MSGPDYLMYPRRRRGMDHERYVWSPITERPAVRWPGGGPVALLAVVCLETFRFDAERKPFTPLGAPTKEYPDYREWSWREYGNRVGAFRLMDVFAHHGVRVTAAVNSTLCARAPFLVEEAQRRGWEIAGHGTTSSDLLHPGVPEDAERALIGTALDNVCAAQPALRSAAGSAPASRSRRARPTCWPSTGSSGWATGRTTTCPTGSAPAAATSGRCRSPPSSRM